jgi:hypothetical protein
VNAFFAGWKEEDFVPLNQYKVVDLVPPKYGEIVDCLGIRSAARLHGWLTEQENGSLIIQDLFTSGDSVHAEAIVYISLLVSMERSICSGKNVFTAVEL